MDVTREIVRGEAYDYAALGRHVVRAMGVCRGRPTFKYTRIKVAGALDRLAAGQSIESIVAGYSGRVPGEAIQEAIHIATRHFLCSLPGLTTA
jgi:uncharacterized protein (DUF433 family)